MPTKKWFNVVYKSKSYQAVNFDTMQLDAIDYVGVDMLPYLATFQISANHGDKMTVTFNHGKYIVTCIEEE